MKKFAEVFALCTVMLCQASCGKEMPQSEEMPVYNTSVVVSAAEAAKPDDALPASIFTDFNGVGEIAETEEKLPLLKQNAMTRIVCSDENGTLYYVNYGMFEDNFIYAYENGESRLLVEEICNYINYCDGSLYYLADDAPPEPFPWSWGGRLFRYDISSGETELVLDEDIYNLYVSDGTMYFCYERPAPKEDQSAANDWYSMKLGEEPRKLGDMLPFFYGKYRLKYSGTGEQGEKCCLALTDGENEILVASEYDYRNTWFTVADGALWVRIGKEANDNDVPAIARIDLSDGARRLYPSERKTASGLSMDITYGPDFAVLDGRLYVVSDSTVFVYNESAEGFEPLLKGHRNCSHIFTDGKDLYAVSFDGEPYNYHTNDILKINTETGSAEVISK